MHIFFFVKMQFSISNLKPINIEDQNKDRHEDC
jgi:hypothetical protein